MKKSRLILMAACGLVLSASADGQQCASTGFGTPLAITIGDDAAVNGHSGLDTNPACVTGGGRVSWLALPDDAAWKVTFTAESPLVSGGLTPATDGTYYQVVDGSHTYTYQVTDGSGTLKATGTLQTIASHSMLRTSAPQTPIKCDQKTFAKTKQLTLSIDPDSDKLVQKISNKEVESICMQKVSKVAWNADDHDIKAWTVVFQDQGHRPTVDSHWGWGDPKASWHQVTCPGCKSGDKPQHHRYQVVAIGKDGKIYRIDPDIIVDPGMNIHRRSDNE